jgi:hypothetical protein
LRQLLQRISTIVSKNPRIFGADLAIFSVLARCDNSMPIFRQFYTHKQQDHQPAVDAQVRQKILESSILGCKQTYKEICFGAIDEIKNSTVQVVRFRTWTFKIQHPKFAYNRSKLLTAMLAMVAVISIMTVTQAQRGLKEVENIILLKSDYIVVNEDNRNIVKPTFINPCDIFFN